MCERHGDWEMNLPGHKRESDGAFGRHIPCAEIASIECHGLASIHHQVDEVAEVHIHRSDNVVTGQPVPPKRKPDPPTNTKSEAVGRSRTRITHARSKPQYGSLEVS